MDTEAGIKTILARNALNEIIVIGGPDTYKEGDDLGLVSLKNEGSLYSKDRKSFTTYDLFRYRLSLYADELSLDEKTEEDFLTEEVKEKLIRPRDTFPCPKKGKKYRANEPRKRLTFSQQREYDTIEGVIDELTEKSQKLEEEMAQVTTDYVRLQELSEEKEKIDAELEEKLERYIELQELVESFQS